jgi:16S rRNA C967 or C1407 C5-methylase (RsmB/RsmF family)
MKDGNLAVLYTKETRKVYATCSVAAEQTEQQSSRAAEQQSTLQVT